MEGLANPGTAYLSEHTAALVGEDFRLRDIGLREVKGAAEPLGIFALEAAAGGTAAPGRRRSGSARMVGRDAELALLEAALGDARESQAQVIGFVAEAGAGKSRLCEELAQLAGAAGVTVRRTSGVSHAQDVPLLPILGLFRDYFAITTGDSPAEIRAKVGARMLGLDAGLDPELGLIFDFLEVPDPDRPAPPLGPDARRRRVLDVIRRLTQRRSERETLLLVLEDLHWFDPQSVAFLDAWLPSFPGTRTLVVTNCRPEFHAPWMARSYYRQLPLPPLDGSAVGELLGELLGPGEDLAAVSRQLRARAGGNPFFAEEIIRGLAGDGTLVGVPGEYTLARPSHEVRVPPTVQAVLTARIDRLAPGEKSVLQAAAVIGRTFTEGILALVTAGDPAALDGVLQSLCAAELLQATPATGEYRFWHPLTQEVAYGTLLSAARSRHHDAVAHALIETGPDRHDELAPLIATHFESAGDDLEAGRWQLRAAVRAIRGDVAEGQRLGRSAIAHLDALPETAETLELGIRTRAMLLRLGARAGSEPGETDRLVAAARPAAERLADPALLTLLYVAEGTPRLSAGDTSGALRSYREGARQAHRVDEPGLRAVLRVGVALTLTYTGPLSEGLTLFEETLAICGDDPLTGTSELGFSAYDAGFAIASILTTLTGQLDRARNFARNAVALYDQRPAEWRVWALAQFAHLADATGEEAELEHASRAADAALRVAADTGNLMSTTKAQHASALVELLAGRPGQAARTVTEALADARRRRCGLQEEPSLLATLARAHLALADAPAARAAADEAVAVARRQGSEVVECSAHIVRARVYRKTATSNADVDEALGAIATGDALATKTGAATYRAFLAEERARLEPDPAAQLAGLKLAADAYTAIGATGHARRLQAEITATRGCG